MLKDNAKGSKSPLLIGGGIFMLLICAYEGRLYGRDLRNGMICTCRFAVTVAIMGAWLMGLHAWKSSSVNNYLGWRYDTLWTWGKIYLCNSQWRSRMICCRRYLARSWSLQNRGSSGMTWSIRVVSLDASLGRRVTSMWTKLSLGVE